MSKLNKKLFWFIGILAICFIGIILLSNTSKDSVEIDYEGQPFIGEASAPVNIIEFGDYKCPHCKDFTEQTYPVIYKELVETGKAKFYFMNYSFIGPDSMTAAVFAETVYQELGNEVFWSFHDLLFKHQTTSDGEMTFFNEDLLGELLTEIVSEEETAKVMSAYREEKGKDAWDVDMQIAKKLNVTATPAIYINGEQFTGNTFDDFIEMVEGAEKHGE